MLNNISKIFVEAGLVGSTWEQQTKERGELVALFRQYYAGEHRLKLTKEMKAMLQINDERLDRYNDNYCEMVVDALNDRLVLDTIHAAGNEQAQTWAQTLLLNNRLDGLQIQVHEAVFRDGETFVMVQYTDDGTILARELAWDGDSGIIPVWDRRGDGLMAAAKVWWDGDVRRVNVYYANQTIKYETNGEELRQIDEESTERDGIAPGVPLVAFRNRGTGRSELTNVLPLQDSLNRTLSSMVMSAELTAFSLLFAVGFKPPNGITPGMVIHAMIEDSTGAQIVTDKKEEAEAYSALMNSYKLERLEAGDLSQLIGQAEFLIDQISTISSTPIPSQMGSSTSSGESLKQRDMRLLGKARRAQVQFGNAWEDVLWLAHLQQQLFGVLMPPETDGFSARWKSAEIRNDADVRETAKLLHEWGYEREALRILSQSSFVQYTEDDITRLLEEKGADSQMALRDLAGSLPGF
jgi:hypothetical protein